MVGSVAVLLFVFSSPSMAMVKKTYQADLTLDDKLFEESLVAEGPSSHLGNCISMCGPECRNFGFNSQKKRCRVHSFTKPAAAKEETGWRYYVASRDCDEMYRKGFTTSGVYNLYPFDNGLLSVSAYCEMTHEGGWTVIQSRKDGSTDFYLTWDSYKRGFGDPERNYWIGNDAIHALTKNLHQTLRVELEKFSGDQLEANYTTFDVGDETSNYLLTISGYAGNAGNRLFYHNGMMFSTKDRDNDLKDTENCAQRYKGAWWYNSCFHSNLNALYVDKEIYRLHHVNWGDISLKSTRLMIKPRH